MMLHLRQALTLVGLVSLASATAHAESKTFKVDPSHSSVGFSVKHLMISKVPGKFSHFEGTFTYDQAAQAIGNAHGTIDTASIDTGDKKRDDHLRSPDFFGVDAKNPKNPNNKISFTLKNFDQKTKAATGDITIHGVTKPITLNVEIGGVGKDPWGNERMAFTATGRLSRKDFGLTWNKALDAGGVVVGDEVTLTLDVEGISDPHGAAAPAKKK